MDCAKVQELLSEYIDDMLDDDMKNEIEHHMIICNKCTQELELLRYMINNCCENEEDLPCDFNQELHKRLLEENHRKAKGRTLSFRKYGIFAAALFILVISFNIISGAGLLDISSSKKAGSMSRSQVASDSSIGIESNKAEAPALKIPNNNGAEQNIMGLDASGANNFNKDMGDAQASMKYETIVINITSDEYKKHYENIISTIEGLNGILKHKEPVQYSMPVSNKDYLMEKFKGEYGIDNIYISTVDFSKEYSDLQSEVYELEKRIQEPGMSSNLEMKEQLSQKTADLKEMSDKSNYVFIEVNRI